MNPTNEAVVGHYYRIVGEDGTVDNTADELLDRVESMAAEVIAKLASRAYTVTGDDVERLMLFIVMLKQRTPQGQEALREADERTGELYLELMLSDREHFHRVMRKRGDTEEQVEAQRLQALEKLRAGRIVGESSPEREVSLMFMAVEHTTSNSGASACVPRSAGSRRSSCRTIPLPITTRRRKRRTPGPGSCPRPTSTTLIPLDRVRAPARPRAAEDVAR